MNRNLLIGLFGMLGLISLSSCQPDTPTYRRGLPQEYTLVYEEIYGRCYDSIPYCVVALDVYSDGLTLDKDHRIKGTGYNLYLSDIFVPKREGADSLRLASGSYHSDTTAAPFTFLPGRDYEGTPHGMYLLNIEEDHIKSIQVIDSGYVEVRDTTNALTDLQFTLYYRNSYGSRSTYKCHFQGELIPWGKQ